MYHNYLNFILANKVILYNYRGWFCLYLIPNMNWIEIVHRIAAKMRSRSNINFGKGIQSNAWRALQSLLHKHMTSAYGASSAHHPGRFVKTTFVTLHCGDAAPHCAKPVRKNGLQCGFQLYRFYERAWTNEALLFIDKWVISIKNHIT